MQIGAFGYQSHSNTSFGSIVLETLAGKFGDGIASIDANQSCNRQTIVRPLFHRFLFSSLTFLRYDDQQQQRLFIQLRGDFTQYYLAHCPHSSPQPEFPARFHDMIKRNLNRMPFQVFEVGKLNKFRRKDSYFSGFLMDEHHKLDNQTGIFFDSKHKYHLVLDGSASKSQALFSFHHIPTTDDTHTPPPPLNSLVLGQIVEQNCDGKHSGKLTVNWCEVPDGFLAFWNHMDRNGESEEGSEEGVEGSEEGVEGCEEGVGSVDEILSKTLDGDGNRTIFTDLLAVAMGQATNNSIVKKIYGSLYWMHPEHFEQVYQ